MRASGNFWTWREGDFGCSLFSTCLLFSLEKKTKTSSAAPARRRHPPRRGRGRPEGRGPGKSSCFLFSFVSGCSTAFSRESERESAACAAAGCGGDKEGSGRAAVLPGLRGSLFERGGGALRVEQAKRASSSKTLVRQLPIAREIRRPLRHRCSCFCRVCDVESLLYDADLVRGEKGSPHGRCCQVFFFSLHRATNHNRRRAFFFSKKKNSTSPFFSNTTTNQNTNRRSSSPRLPSPAPAEGPPGLPLPPLLPPLPLP